MSNDEILTILKIDLQISTSAMDDYLTNLIVAAQGYITTEGINLTSSVEDGMLIEMYAAYLYRRRREEDVGMPRMLRWALNNRLFSQNGGDGLG